jgi:hypothetical protein
VRRHRRRAWLGGCTAKKFPFARVIANRLAHLLLERNGERMIGGLGEPHFIGIILKKGGLEVDVL